MRNLRTYGSAPFKAAVIHGGPGAVGEMASVARELSAHCGILEPLQTAASLEGQVEELKIVLEQHGDLPITLIGFSWGAWLSFIVTARYPVLVGRLILVGSGPFEEKYIAKLEGTRLNRLNAAVRAEFASLLSALGDPVTKNKDALMVRLSTLLAKTDEYDPIPAVSDTEDMVGIQGETFQRVWDDAAKLRRSGELLAFGKSIQCPVVALHGDYDPHPAEGVQDALTRVLKNFRFILLKNCGHKPWVERQARD